MNHLRSR